MLNKNWNLVKFKCKHCSKSIWAFPSRKRVHCSECSKFRQIRYRCKHCKKEFYGHKSRKYKYCSQKCCNNDRKGKKRLKEIREKVRKNIPRGKEHYNYKGGVYSMSLYYEIRHSLEMREWSKKVFERDNYTCQDCGIKSGCGKKVYLEAHHKKEFIEILNENNIRTFEDAQKCEELWNISNGRTLCKKCHNLTKGKEKIYANILSKS